jgi:hypothetical protein
VPVLASASGRERALTKREVRARLRNMTSPNGRKNRGGNNEFWIHSLSKIQMNQLLEKCLELHQYCVAEDELERGETGPPGTPGLLGKAGGLQLASGRWIAHAVATLLPLSGPEGVEGITGPSGLRGPQGPDGELYRSCTSKSA